MSDYGQAVWEHHAHLLADSAVLVDVARERGYKSISAKKELGRLGFTSGAQNIPGLLIPIRDETGEVVTHQYRPDEPRTNRAGKPVKYETPKGTNMVVDVPRRVRDRVGNPSVPLWLTEGARKADAAAGVGLACVALLGVWNWRGRNDQDATVALAAFESFALRGRKVYVAYDSDVMQKPAVHTALCRLGAFLQHRGATVAYAYLPSGDGTKVGLDDYLAAGGTVADLVTGARAQPIEPLADLEPEPPPPVPEPPSPAPLPEAVSLTRVHEAFRRWFGDAYDLDALDAVLCTAAVEQLPGDPVWMLVISGSGATKTETVTPLGGAGAEITSTIASEGALLSGTSQRERSKTATGGLLRKLGDRGLLVIKDVTSVLAMNRDSRGAVLAAMREVYDGRWERNLGSDGGQSLTWTGRIVVVGAVTTAWDKAHEVIAAMGDRFVLVRVDSTTGRVASGRQAMTTTTGQETTMRAELAGAVGGLLAHLNRDADLELTEDEVETLLCCADLVTLARTGVEHDYRGDVIDAHAPEMPTRFAKQLTQPVRGGLALGLDRAHVLDIAVRCARDSVPPLRLAALQDVADHPGSTTHAVRQRMEKPRATVDRTLQALYMLGLVRVDEVHDAERKATVWYYTLASDDHSAALKHMRGSARNVGRDAHPSSPTSFDPSLVSKPPCNDKSGTTPARASGPVCADCGVEPTGAEQGDVCLSCAAARRRPA